MSSARHRLRLTPFPNPSIVRYRLTKDWFTPSKIRWGLATCLVGIVCIENSGPPAECDRVKREHVDALECSSAIFCRQSTFGKLSESFPCQATESRDLANDDNNGRRNVRVPAFAEMRR